MAGYPGLQIVVGIVAVTGATDMRAILPRHSPHLHIAMPKLMAVPEERTPIALNDLPPLVRQRLEKDFASWALASASKLERNDYIHYYVSLRAKDGATKTVEVLENGELVPGPASPK